ncbi:hypothetical protein BH11BAC3_BH11BAC3_22540 [soil metagenome]
MKSTNQNNPVVSEPVQTSKQLLPEDKVVIANHCNFMTDECGDTMWDAVLAQENIYNDLVKRATKGN